MVTAVMGENLALNIERNGFPISVYNHPEKQRLLWPSDPGNKLNHLLEDFVASWSDRKILIMVKAGAPVDAVIGLSRYYWNLATLSLTVEILV